MMGYKRSLTITLTAIVTILGALAGFMTASGGPAIQLIETGPSVLTTAQWVAIQASTSLLMGGLPLPTYLPLVFR